MLECYMAHGVTLTRDADAKGEKRCAHSRTHGTFRHTFCDRSQLNFPDLSVSVVVMCGTAIGNVENRLPLPLAPTALRSLIAFAGRLMRKADADSLLEGLE